MIIPLFGNRGQLLRGREKGRGYVLPGEFRVVSMERWAVSTRMQSRVNTGSYVVADLSFRPRLIVPVYPANGWLEERPHLPGGGR